MSFKYIVDVELKPSKMTFFQEDTTFGLKVWVRYDLFDFFLYMLLQIVYCCEIFMFRMCTLVIFVPYCVSVEECIRGGNH